MINKNGIITSPNFYESEAMYMVRAKGLSYVPGTGVNSCQTLISWRFDYSTGITTDTIFRVIANISWEGFDSSNPDGSFNIWFQEARLKPDSGSWVWAGTAFPGYAMNRQQSVVNLVLSQQTGSYTYNTTFKLSQDFIDNYDGLILQYRSDYSNGIGRINTNDIMIIQEDYYAGNGQDIKAHMNNNYISTNNIIEM